MKLIYKCLLLIFAGFLLILLNHYSFSYSRRIGNTRFFLVETMINSKEGKPLAGLYYKTDTSGYCGENTPGFPKTIYWNDRYIISKNFDGNNPKIVEYVIINLDSINPYNGEIKDIHRFVDEKEYYLFMKNITLSEADMNQTDNHIAWWSTFFRKP